MTRKQQWVDQKKKKQQWEIMITGSVSNAMIFYCVDQRSTRLSRKQNKKVNCKKKTIEK